MMNKFSKLLSELSLSKISISSIYDKLVQLSPYIEVEFRILYWKNVKYLKRFKKQSKTNQVNSFIDLDLVIGELRSRIVQENPILIIHSSYDLLSRSGLNPDQINQKLLDLSGENGTLVMPAIRRYSEEGPMEKVVNSDYQDFTCVYDTVKSPIVSGMLPFFLTRRKDAHVSHFPLNPVVAVGKYAQEMIVNNLNGNFLTPHGPNSAWKFCLDRNAIVISLGVELPKYLTIIHTYEECHSNWPIPDWFQKRKFTIKHKDKVENVEVYERKAFWGKYFFAERNLRKDLLKAGVLEEFVVSGLEINIIASKNLLDFLSQSKSPFYPYYIKRKFLR